MDRSADDISTIISGMQRDMEELKSTQLTGDNIANESITTEKLADHAVTTEKMDWSTITSGESSSGWNRADIGYLHLLWKNYSPGGATTGSWNVIGTLPDDLTDATLVLGQWTPGFASSADCESHSCQISSGEIKAQIVSPSGNNEGRFLVILFK